MKKKALITVLVLCTFIGTVFGADYYETGSQIFMISAGVDIPFTNTYKDTATGEFKTLIGMGEDGTHINIGGLGSLDYEVFTSSKTSIGGEIGYQFNYCTDEVLFTQVPMCFKFSYVPVQGMFEIPISLGIGLSYMSYNEKSIMSPMAMATIGFRFFPTENWGFGIKTGIKGTFELYLSNSDRMGVGTFIPVHFFATYRH